MTRYLLLLLFVGTMGSRLMGLEFGLGPGLSIKNAMLYAAFSVIAIDAVVARNRKLQILPVLLPFALLIAYAMMTWLITVLFLDNPYYRTIDTFIRLKGKLIDQLLILLVFFYGVIGWRDALWLMKALVWAIFLGCLITVVDSFNIPDLGIITAREADGRVEGIIGSSQEFGGVLAYFLPAGIALLWTESGLKKGLAILGIAVTLVSILISASRGAMVGVAMGAVIAGFYLRQYISAQFLVRATIAVLFFVAVALVAVLSSDYGYLLTTRLSTGLETGNLETLSSGRTEIWSSALREMGEFPFSYFTGLGWEAYYETAGHRFATHSVYLDRIYNLGIFGFTLFAISFVNAARVARRGLLYAPQGTAPFLIATIIGLIAFMIAMAFSDINIAATYVWAMAGLALRIAVSGQADTSAQTSLQRLDLPPTHDHATPTTRPTSVTPNR